MASQISLVLLACTLFLVPVGARRCNGFSDQHNNTDDEQSILRALNCVCSDTFEDAGYTDSSFIGVTGIFTGLLAYTVFTWLCQLDLHEVKHIKRYFQAFALFKTTMDADIDGVKQTAVCRIEGIKTAADIMKSASEKDPDLALKEAKTLLEEKLQRARLTPLKDVLETDREEVLNTVKEAEIGPRKLINTAFAMHFLVCTFIAMVDFYSNPVVKCGAVGRWHRLHALIYYKVSCSNLKFAFNMYF
jgi:membrane carboxypeptidase/penicillin-binding protein PbpC